MLKRVYLTIIIISNQPWWPSGLRLHAISQLIIAAEGPGFESPLGIMILITGWGKNWDLWDCKLAFSH